jgi:hypothetical protein
MKRYGLTAPVGKNAGDFCRNLKAVAKVMPSKQREKAMAASRF